MPIVRLYADDFILLLLAVFVLGWFSGHLIKQFVGGD